MAQAHRPPLLIAQPKPLARSGERTRRPTRNSDDPTRAARSQSHWRTSRRTCRRGHYPSTSTPVSRPCPVHSREAGAGRHPRSSCPTWCHTQLDLTTCPHRLSRSAQPHYHHTTHAEELNHPPILSHGADHGIDRRRPIRCRVYERLVDSPQSKSENKLLHLTSVTVALTPPPLSDVFMRTQVIPGRRRDRDPDHVGTPACVQQNQLQTATFSDDHDSSASSDVKINKADHGQMRERTVRTHATPLDSGGACANIAELYDT